MSKDTFVRPTSIFGFRLFADLPSTECETIVSAARERRVWRGQTIFYEGDRICEVLMPVSGCVKLTQTGINGDEAILRLIGPGEIVGTIFGCESGQYCSAQAIQKTSLLAWDIDLLEWLLEKFPSFRRNVINAVEETLIEMEHRFWRASTQSVASRVSGELLRLASRWEPKSTGERKVVLSQTELAQLTGTAASTVSRLLRQWQTRGIVAIHRKAITVQNSDALARLADSE